MSALVAKGANTEAIDKNRFTCERFAQCHRMDLKNQQSKPSSEVAAASSYSCKTETAQPLEVASSTNKKKAAQLEVTVPKSSTSKKETKPQSTPASKEVKPTQAKSKSKIAKASSEPSKKADSNIPWYRRIWRAIVNFIMSFFTSSKAEVKAPRPTSKRSSSAFKSGSKYRARGTQSRVNVNTSVSSKKRR